MKHKDEVMFRRWPEGEVIALFPYIIATTTEGFVESYMHVGQHSGADLEIIHCTKPANLSESDTAMLYNELTQIGYHLKVIKRVNWDRHIAEWNRARAMERYLLVTA